MSASLIFFNQRLGDLSGHRLAQARGFLAAAQRRGMTVDILASAGSTEELLAALPCRPVLHDPVFQLERSFDERTADVVSMLHQHVDPGLRSGDRFFHPVATQCEGRALLHWLGDLPAAQRPWCLALIVSDRWNRHGAAERERQLGEFRTLAAELAQSPAEVGRKLIFAAYTTDLLNELKGMLGVEPLQVPFTVNLDHMQPAERAPRARPVVCCVGGARPEKGFHKIAGIVRECRRRQIPVDFLLHLINEQLSAEVFAELCSLTEEPGVRGVYGALDRGPYRAMLAEADILLSPYERIPYRQRNSDILIEAGLIGLPAVVPSGTWLSDQIDCGAVTGVAYEGEDAASIAIAIGRCVEALPELACQAVRRAAHWTENQGIDLFLDRFEGEIRRRQDAAPGLVSKLRRVLLGAGSRR